MMNRRGISLAFAAVAAAGAIAVPAFALAGNGGGAATTLSEPVPVQQVEAEADESDTRRFHLRHRGARRGAALSEALGVDIEVLKAATQAARESLGDRPDEITPEVIEARRAAFASALAAELGLSEAELTAASEALKAERLSFLAEKLAEAVENGRITQDEADAALDRIENGERPHGHRLRFHGFRGGLGPSAPTGTSA